MEPGPDLIGPQPGRCSVGGEGTVAAGIGDQRPGGGGQCVQQLPQQFLAGPGGLNLAGGVVSGEQRPQPAPLLVGRVPGAA